MIIAYTNSHYGRTAKDILIADLTHINIHVLKTILVGYTVTNTEYLSKLIKTYMPSGGIIVSILEAAAKYDFIKGAHDNGIVSPLYTIFAVGLDLNQLKYTTYYKYLVGHYFLCANVGPEGTKMERMLNEVYPFIPFFTTDMYYSTIAIQLWEATIEHSKSIEVENLLIGVNNMVVRTALGTLVMETNHHLSMPHSIMTVTATNNYGQIYYNFQTFYENDFTHSPNPFTTKYMGDMYYTCNWQYSNGNEAGEKLEQFQFGVMLLLSSKDEPNYYEILVVCVALINQINDNGGVLGGRLNLIVQNYYDGEPNFENKIHSLLNKYPTGILVGCTTVYCRKLINPIQLEFGAVLIVPNKMEGNACEIATFYAGPVPNQVVSMIHNYATSQEHRKDVIILYKKDEKWDLCREILENQMRGDFNIQANMEITIENAISIHFVRNLLELTTNSYGSYIFAFLDAKDLLKLLNNLKLVMLYNPSFIQVFTMAIPPLQVKKYVDVIPYPLYYVTGVDSPVTDSSIIKKYTPMLQKYIGFVNLVDDSYSTALGIEAMKITIENAGLELEDVESFITNLYLNDEKTTIFDKSNYLTRDIYIYEYNMTGAYVVRSSIKSIPQPYSWELEENYGKQCDHSKEIGNEVSVVETIKALLITSNSGKFLQSYRGVEETFIATVTEINNDKVNPGIKGFLLDYAVVDDESDEYICAQKAISLLDSTTFTVVFAVANSLCLDLIHQKITEKRVLLWHIGIYGGESCIGSVAQVGIDPITSEIVIERFLNQKIHNFAIINLAETFSTTFGAYVEQYIIYLGGTVSAKLVADESGSNIESIATSLVSRLPKGGVIMFLGTSQQHIMLHQALVSRNIGPDDYIFYSFSTSEEVASRHVYPFYGIGHYFNSIDNEENRHLKELLKYPLPNDVPINHFHEGVYSALKYWANVQNIYKHLFINQTRNQFYDEPYDSPGGKMLVNTNNMIYRPVYTAYYDGNDEGTMKILTKEDLGYPRVWKKFLNTGVYICNLNDSSIGQKYKLPSHKITVLAPLTGKDETVGREIVSGALLAVNEINANNGVISNRIELEIVDTMSDESKIGLLGKEVMDQTGITAVFGGSYNEEYLSLRTYFTKTKKLFFYSGISAGEFCDAFGIVVNCNANHLIKAGKSVFTETMFSYYIVLYSNDSFSNVVFSTASSLLSQLGINYECYLYDGNEALFDDLYEKYPNGALVLDILHPRYSLEVAKLMYSRFTYPKFVFMHYFVNDIILKGNEQYFNYHTMWGSWFSIIGKQKSREYSNQNEFYEKAIYRYRDTVIVSDVFESTYTAVKLWANGVREAFSFDPIPVRKGMIGKNYLAGSSEVNLNNNNVVSRRIYRIMIVNGNYIIRDSALDLIEANSFSQWMKETEGVICDYRLHDGIYQYEKRKRFVLVVENDYKIREEKYNTWLGTEFAVDQINEAGGILGYYIILNIVIVDTVKIENATLPYAEMEEVVAFFGCLDFECQSVVSKIANTYKKIFFSYVRSYGGLYSPYTFMLGPILSQKIEAAFTWLKARFNNLYILMDEENENSYFDVTRKMFSYLSMNSFGYKIIKKGGSCEITMNAITRMAQTVSDIVLVTALTEEHLESCIPIYNKNKLNKKRVLFLFLNYNHYEFGKYNIKDLEGSFIPINYHQAITSISNTAFLKEAYNRYSRNFYVSANYEISYSSVLLFELGIQKAQERTTEEWPSNDYIRLSMKDVKYDAPSGIIQMTDTNYLIRPIYVIDIIDGIDFGQDSPLIGESVSYYPNAFLDGVPEKYITKPETKIIPKSKELRVMGYILFAVNMLIILSSVYLSFRYRKKRIIKCASPLFSYLLHYSLTLANVSVLLLVIEIDKDSTICGLRVLFSATSILQISETYCAKAIAYSSTKKRRIHKISISLIEWIKFFVIQYLPLLVIIVIYLTTSKSEYTLYFLESESTFLVSYYTEECTFSYPFVIIIACYIGLFLAFTLINSIKTKNIANEFNDSLFLMLSSLILFALPLVLFILDFIVDDHRDSLLLIRGIGYNLVIMFLTLLQLIPKIVFIFANEESLVETDSHISSTHISRSIAIHSTTTMTNRSTYLNHRSLKTQIVTKN